MPVKIEPNAEPIPGYRLIERLGGGGFGEVWKAEAPGGLMKAIKFVYGDLMAADDANGSRAEQELKALSRVKTVRHSYILSIERFDIIDGQLIIVTELADKTLWDRFREVRNTGLPGVAREELLAYMEEAAEALDLMNEEYQLQHLDIKPQNLFLVYNHIKVADFGLAKDMGNKAAATMTGGVTPVYAAPETFDGWLSRYSDQYSLAIVYQEILTGQRPFTGSTMRQLVLQHLQMAPDLSSLPVADRPIIARALSKNHEERWPSCKILVKELRAATTSGGVRPLPAVPVRNDSAAASPPGEMERENVDEEQVTQGKRGTKTPAPADEADQKGPSLENRPQVLPPRPGARNDAAPAVSEVTGGTIPTAAYGHRHGEQVAGARPDEHKGQTKGILQPALILGLGKLGLDTLRQVRKLIIQEFGHADALPQVRLLGIDTDSETIQAAGHGDADTVLRTYEMLLAKLHRPSHYLKTREGKPPPPDSWLNSKLLFRIPRQQNGAGLRPLGRLAFVDNYRLISRRLEGELQSCAPEDTLHEMAGQSDMGLRSKVPRVYVVTSLGGTTGGAMFIDAAYLLRHILRKQGYPNAEVVGLLLVPSADHAANRSLPLANTYAALTELNYFSSGKVFSAKYDTGEQAGGNRAFTEAGPPFQRCLMLNLPDAKATAELAATTAQAAQFLYRDLATVLGPALEETRRPHQQTYHMVGKAHYQTFGLYRLLWPRRRLLQQAARNLCRRLVESWMTKDARPIAEQVKEWSLEQWDALNMRPEELITCHREQCEKKFGQSPEGLIQGLIQPLGDVIIKNKTPGKGGTGELNCGPVVQVMDQLEKQLGLPEECRPPDSVYVEPGPIEKALTDASETLAAESEQKLLEVIVKLIEQPSYRLAGAEEALRQFCRTVEKTLENQEPLAKELHDKSVLVHQRIAALLEASPVLEETRTTSMWKFGRRGLDKNNIAEELLELLNAYAKCRFQSLILFHVNRLYVSLRGHLSDQIRDVGFCRHRLGELAGMFGQAPGGAPKDVKHTSGGDKYLMPEGCARFEDSFGQLDKKIGPEQLAAFDQRIQTLIDKDFRALVHVCTEPSRVVKNLGPAMLREAEEFLEPFLQGASVSDLFLKQADDGQPIKDSLLEAYDEAAPELGKATAGKEICVVVVPKDEAGIKLEDALADVLPGVKVANTERTDEIIFYREQLQLTSSDLEQLGPVAQEAFQHRDNLDPGTLHSREDIAEWQSASCAVSGSHS